MTSTKHTPKSCGCNQCRYAKGSDSGQFFRRNATRADRHAAKIELRRGGEPLGIVSAPRAA